MTSGFAYDRPVPLSGYGTFNLTIVTVAPDGTNSTQSVKWTVSGRGKPNYIPIVEGDAFVSFTETTKISIPDTVYWAAGDTSTSVPEVSEMLILWRIRSSLRRWLSFRHLSR